MSYISSYYASSANAAPERLVLEGDHHCDICVIGAGYAGLSTALHLAEKGYKVIVLEAEKTGWGASGRNGGQIINGYSRDYDTIRARYGEDTARALLNMGFEGADIIRDHIKKYNINCNHSPEGSFFAAFNDSQMKFLERRKAIWAEGGNNETEIISRDKLSDYVGSALYCGGLLDKRGGHIHPLNLALGEAAALESLGGKIFEKSRVLSIDTGTKPKAITERGSVSAAHIVVCGNAYIGNTAPQLQSRFMSVSSQIITTAPLTDAQASALLPGRHCVEDCNFLLDYYRITADRRLLFGGGVVYSGTTPHDIEGRLSPKLLRVFPMLQGVKIDYAWSCNFALTLTRMPHIGRLSDTVYFIHGDSGHGVTTTHLLGRLTAEAVAGQAERYDIFANMKNYPFPGGRVFRIPFTALGAWYYGLREKMGI
ncbi:MAG: FAD-binding oxidoreductase [Alphaproteobacteria bacterium]|nr:FAD-binding oxidoreductase [Alphaproteobacteria bacterium]